MLKEDARERALRYLEMTAKSLENLKEAASPMEISSQNIERVVELAKSYVNDSRHYLDSEKHVTSLACVAYAEGLLDALKYLQLANF